MAQTCRQNTAMYKELRAFGGESIRLDKCSFRRVTTWQTGGQTPVLDLPPAGQHLRVLVGRLWCSEGDQLAAFRAPLQCSCCLGCEADCVECVQLEHVVLDLDHCAAGDDHV